MHGLSITTIVGVLSPFRGQADTSITFWTSDYQFHIDKASKASWSINYSGKSWQTHNRTREVMNWYIQFAKLDGKVLNKPRFYHSDLLDGGTLILEMGPKLNEKRGNKPEDAPPSMSPKAEYGNLY